MNFLLVFGYTQFIPDLVEEIMCTVYVCIRERMILVNALKGEKLFV